MAGWRGGVLSPVTRCRDALAGAGSSAPRQRVQRRRSAHRRVRQTPGSGDVFRDAFVAPVHDGELVGRQSEELGAPV